MGCVRVMSALRAVCLVLAGFLAWGVPSDFCLAQVPRDSVAEEASVVVLSWERLGEDDEDEGADSGSGDFESQIQELERGGHTPVSLSEVVAAVRTGHALPPLAVALTFDGGRSEILKRAVPLLLRKRIPFAVFFSSDKADRGGEGYLTWADLRALLENPLVTLGIHPAVYTRLTSSPPEEITRQINRARVRYREELGSEPAFFAYPFGAASAAYRAAVERQNFRGAFGVQSGAAGPLSDLYFIPRFSVMGGYGDVERFRMIARALALPARNVAPEDPLLAENPPRIGFSVTPADGESLERLSCSSSGQGRPKIEILGGERVELRFPAPFDEEQVRIVCTLPAALPDTDEVPRWRWIGFLLTVPERLLP